MVFKISLVVYLFYYLLTSVFCRTWGAESFHRGRLTLEFWDTGLPLLRLGTVWGVSEDSKANVFL